MSAPNPYCSSCSFALVALLSEIVACGCPIDARFCVCFNHFRVRYMPAVFAVYNMLWCLWYGHMPPVLLYAPLMCSVYSVCCLVFHFSVIQTVGVVCADLVRCWYCLPNQKKRGESVGGDEEGWAGWK